MVLVLRVARVRVVLDGVKCPTDSLPPANYLCKLPIVSRDPFQHKKTLSCMGTYTLPISSKIAGKVGDSCAFSSFPFP